MNNKSLTKTNKKYKPKKVANIYKDGSWKKASGEALNAAFSSENLGSTLGVIGGAVGDIATAGIANAEVDTTAADNAIDAVESFQPATASLDALANSYNNTTFADTDYNHKDFMVSTGEGLANMGKAALSGAAAGATVGGPWGALIGGVADALGSGAGWIAGGAKARKEAERLEREAKIANLSATNKALSARDSILENKTNEFMRNVASYGGPLFNLSGEFDNGLTFINEGDTHENNPFDGVQVGIDNQGIPNLVEEGEIIYNDYVFSNRLKPTKKLLNDGGFSDKYVDWTFAKIVEDLQKESAERPNDIISKEGLNDMMNRMINMQESIRAKKKQQNNIFAKGGPAGIDPYLTGKAVDISDIINTANQEVLFEETPFELDTFEDLPAVTPALNLGEMQTTKPITKGIIAESPAIGIDPKIQGLLNGALSVDAFNQDTNDYIQDGIDSSIKNRNSRFNWKQLGMATPIISNAAKAIYNAAKPIDESNIVAEQAFRETPLMNLPRLEGKQVYRGIDKNRLTTPIINQGRATARDIQNLGTTGTDVLNRLAINNYNTQRAVGEAYANAEQQDLANRMQVAQFNLGIDQANANLSQAEQAANIQRANRIAQGLIADANMREQLGMLKGQAIDKTGTAAIQGIADLTRQGIEWDWIRKNPEYAEAVRAIAKNGEMLTRKRK